MNDSKNYRKYFGFLMKKKEPPKRGDSGNFCQFIRIYLNSVNIQLNFVQVSRSRKELFNFFIESLMNQKKSIKRSKESAKRLFGA